VVAPGSDAVRAGLVLVKLGGLGAGGNVGGFVHGEAFGIGGEDGHGREESEENRQWFHVTDSSIMTACGSRRLRFPDRSWISKHYGVTEELCCSHAPVP
jgi:hypothetical protein